MKAIVYDAGSTEIHDVADPVLRAGDALISVERTGLCGTDLGIVRNGRPRVSEMVTLGHEIFGRLADGTRAVVDPFVSCGSCTACRRGDTNLCTSLRIIGVHRAGGFASALTVPSGQIVAVPDHITDAQASIVEPVATALHAWRRAQALGSTSVGVVGAGAIGLSVIAVALAHGASVSVADIDPTMREHAAAQGAGRVATSLEGTFDVVFDCVGLLATRRDAVESTRAGGTTILIGLADTDLSVPGRSLVTYERTLRGSFGYRHQDFIDAVGIVASMPTAWVGEFSLAEIVDLLTGDTRLAAGIAKAQFVRRSGLSRGPVGTTQTEVVK